MSRFFYGVPGDTTDWTTELPVRPWARTTRTIGGSRIAAGGVPASHVVRRDYILAITLRLYEHERDELDALVAMNPAALAVHLKDLSPGGLLLVNTAAFTAENLKMAVQSVAITFQLFNKKKSKKLLF
jgi:Pyruvate/2-oxoacid:ferredoxin oxidoreductase gamma subunit